MKNIVLLFCISTTISCGSRIQPASESTLPQDSVNSDPREGKWFVERATGDFAFAHEGMEYVFEDGKLTTIAGAIVTTGPFHFEKDTLEWKINNTDKNLVKFGWKIEEDELVLTPATRNDVLYLRKISPK